MHFENSSLRREAWRNETKSDDKRKRTKTDGHLELFFDGQDTTEWLERGVGGRVVALDDADADADAGRRLRLRLRLRLRMQRRHRQRRRRLVGRTAPARRWAVRLRASRFADLLLDVEVLAAARQPEVGTVQAVLFVLFLRKTNQQPFHFHSHSFGFFV